MKHIIIFISAILINVNLLSQVINNNIIQDSKFIGIWSRTTSETIMGQVVKYNQQLTIKNTDSGMIGLYNNEFIDETYKKLNNIHPIILKANFENNCLVFHYSPPFKLTLINNKLFTSSGGTNFIKIAEIPEVQDSLNKIERDKFISYSGSFTGYLLFTEYNPKLVNTSLSKKGWYSGELKNGKPDGYGKFVGTVQSSNKYGSFLYTDNQFGLYHLMYCYEGYWKNGLFEGEGTYYISGVDKYIKIYQKGNWKNNEFLGDLELIAKQKQVENGTYTGTLIYDYPEGRYEGNFINGKRDGFGKQYLSNGEWYEGNFKNGYANGQGTFRQDGGIRYTGNFVNGKRQGKFIAQKWTLAGLIADSWELVYDNDILTSKNQTSSGLTDFVNNMKSTSSSSPVNTSTPTNVNSNKNSKTESIQIEFREVKFAGCMEGIGRLFKVFKNGKNIDVEIKVRDFKGYWYKGCSDVLPDKVEKSSYTLKQALIRFYKSDNGGADNFLLIEL